MIISDVTNPRIPYKQDIEHSCRTFNLIRVFQMLENIPWVLNELTEVYILLKIIKNKTLTIMLLQDCDVTSKK